MWAGSQLSSNVRASVRPLQAYTTFDIHSQKKNIIISNVSEELMVTGSNEMNTLGK